MWSGDSGELEAKDEGKGPGTWGMGDQALSPPGFAWGPWSTLTLEEHLSSGGCLVSQKLPGFMTRPDGQTIE